MLLTQHFRPEFLLDLLSAVAGAFDDTEPNLAQFEEARRLRHFNGTVALPLGGPLTMLATSCVAVIMPPALWR